VLTDYRHFRGAVAPNSINYLPVDTAYPRRFECSKHHSENLKSCILHLTLMK